MLAKTSGGNGSEYTLGYFYIFDDGVLFIF